MGRVERRGSLSSGSDDDEDDEKCPLCCEDLDVTDRNFFPCPCGYQVRALACLGWAGCFLVGPEGEIGTE